MPPTTGLVVHADCSLHDTGWKHPEHQGRLPSIVRAVERDMVVLHGFVLQVEARPATEGNLLRVHTPEHIEALRAAVTLAAAEGTSVLLAPETPVSSASWAAALAAAGTVVSGVDLVHGGVTRNAFCVARPPGRGASAEESGDFCLVNNTAVGVRYLQAVHGVRRVLVIDWAAEPPRGTSAIFATDAEVYLLSGAYGPAELDAAMVIARPEWILLSADFGEELETVHERTWSLRERAELACGGRLVSVLEGGYDAAVLGKAVVQHLRALAGLPPA